MQQERRRNADASGVRREQLEVPMSALTGPAHAAIAPLKKEYSVKSFDD